MTSDQPWWLTMPPAEVAATILPLFSHSPYVFEDKAIDGIVGWCRTGQYREPRFSTTGRFQKFEHPDVRAIAEAMRVLEHAGLLMRASGGDLDVVGLTRLGHHALATNTVRQHLGPGDATAAT
jgi:hypothetical protein